LRLGDRAAAGIFASALLVFLYARGELGWLLGFVALVPWLCTLDANRSWVATLLSAWAMSVAYTVAAFAWFGLAIGGYTQLGPVVGLAILLLAAPLFQPQIVVAALVRRFARQRHGLLIGALAGAAAWVATEWLVPRLLGDTFGYGLYPSRLMRQAADLGGVAGLTLVLLLANEAVAAALVRRDGGLRAMARPLALAALLPMLLGAYGAVALGAAPTSSGKPLRIGLIQSNIVDYERLRREKGAGAVVREVLDTHFAMTYDAIERQRADAVLWSETVYPTTFGQPKSEAGAELDREILAFVDAAGVPFVFGTYDRDATGEYNAAAFVAPGSGLLGFYRKTRAFPLTEHVPGWLDGATLRRWLPWTGSWLPGNGARVFPLRLADGREIPVVPLICLDDMDAGLAVAGARLGAQAILTMSNDSWFADSGQGAELHQAAAAFRSIETRLPQFRVTPNGYSAVIDATGSVIAGSRLGERTLVMGEVPVGERQRTLRVAWGDWVGGVALAFLALLAMLTLIRQWRAHGTEAGQAAFAAPALPANVAVLPPAARIVAGVLRAFARGSLLWMVTTIVFGDGSLQSKTLVQMRTFAALFLLPEAAAWCVLRAFAARASIEQGVLVLSPRRAAPRARADRNRRGRALARADPECWRLAAACLRRALGVWHRASRSGRPRARTRGSGRRAGAGGPAIARGDVCASRSRDAARSSRSSAGKVRAASAAACDPSLPAPSAHRIRRHVRRIHHLRPGGLPHDVCALVGRLGDRRGAVCRSLARRDRARHAGRSADAAGSRHRDAALARASRPGSALRRRASLAAAAHRRGLIIGRGSIACRARQASRDEGP
jgi:apolipoprotein N-acyltransferase